MKVKLESIGLSLYFLMFHILFYFLKQAINLLNPHSNNKAWFVKVPLALRFGTPHLVVTCGDKALHSNP